MFDVNPGITKTLWVLLEVIEWDIQQQKMLHVKIWVRIFTHSFVSVSYCFPELPNLIQHCSHPPAAIMTRIRMFRVELKQIKLTIVIPSCATLVYYTFYDSAQKNLINFTSHGENYPLSCIPRKYFYTSLPILF